MDRRGFLLGTSLTAAAVAAGLTGCTDQTGQPSSREAGSGELPTRVPFVVKPDLPEVAGGVPPGYFSYPAEPVKREGFPVQGASGPITSLLQTGATIAPKSSNVWWQKIEEASGFTFDVTGTLSADYQAKLQVTLAGGDVPDLVQIVGVPGLPGVLDKYFTDLTPYLSGDAIKEYPGLAAIPTETWKIGQVNGKIWGIAQPRPPAGTIMTYRGDMFAKAGITETPELRDGQDFLDMCEQVTDARNSVYAIGSDPAGWMVPAMLEMMGAPNQWQDDGGKLTHAYETDVMKAAIDQVAQMYKKSYLHPDSNSVGSGNVTWWQSGRTSIYLQAFTGWGGFVRQYPDWNVGAVILPKWDGGGPAAKHLGVAGYGAYVSIKKGSEERTKELLRFCDFLASPFGTEEQFLLAYGIEGKHFKREGSDPVRLPATDTDVVPGIGYVGSQGATVLYTPKNEGIVRQQYEYLKEILPSGITNPVLGLYSDAAATSGATATTTMNDLIKEIVVGRKSTSDWDAQVDRWRSETGDKQRQEFQDALQQK
ncbi:extracellular solute-binding protein [Microlunatus speluncae]|uniref:extracellular solute-binding protein n=1 Tax=Microlunatus speluncae TaxID=2594267 RepID=UPI0012660ECB|nr:extracellular solute-binding protein [Microlunatus speluncae]